MIRPERQWVVAENVWLDNAEAAAERAPATFLIPPESERKSLSKGDWAKLTFHFPEPVMHKGHPISSERLWVEVAGTIWKDDVLTYIGKLKSKPFHDEPLSPGASVRFQPVHVCGRERPPPGWKP